MTNTTAQCSVTQQGDTLSQPEPALEDGVLIIVGLGRVIHSCDVNALKVSMAAAAASNSDPQPKMDTIMSPD